MSIGCCEHIPAAHNSPAAISVLYFAFLGGCPTSDGRVPACCSAFEVPGSYDTELACFRQFVSYFNIFTSLLQYIIYPASCLVLERIYQEHCKGPTLPPEALEFPLCCGAEEGKDQRMCYYFPLKLLLPG